MSEQDQIVIINDAVAETLDDMAALADYWKRNRENGRTPNSIRNAMVLVCREVVSLNDFEKRYEDANTTR